MKNVSKHALLVFLLFFSVLRLPAEESKKLLIVIADFGSKGPSPEILSLVQKNPPLRLTIAWPAGLEPSLQAMTLARERRMEAALCLADEPVLPLLYETSISSPFAAQFACPEDARDIIFRNQEEFRSLWTKTAGGLYLRTGVFSDTLMSDIKRFGLMWVTIDGVADISEGVYRKGNFLFIVPKKNTFSSPQECWQWIAENQSPVVALVFPEQNALTPPLLLELAVRLKENPEIRMITPDKLLPDTTGVIDAANLTLESDTAPWRRNAAVWVLLSQLRQAVEDYKNSGLAQIRTLDALHEQLYKLYRYDMLSRFDEQVSPESDGAFQEHVKRISSLLPASFAVTPSVSADTSALSASTAPVVPSFLLEADSTTLTVLNSVSSRSLIGIDKFTAVVDDTFITYNVQLRNSVADNTPVRVDIYIDLNNQLNAGLSAFLKGLDGFMRSDDAWEYALRFERSGVSLYRSGRFSPMLIQSFSRSKTYEIKIPRSLFKGNPLLWGYQAVTSFEPIGSGAAGIDDFLCSDDDARQRLHGEVPVQLPAVRVMREQQ